MTETADDRRIKSANADKEAMREALKEREKETGDSSYGTEANRQKNEVSGNKAELDHRSGNDPADAQPTSDDESST